jgi:alanine dehydrogenase
MARVLSAADVRTLLPMEACIDAVEDAVVAFSAGQVEMPTRLTVRAGDRGYVQAMPAYNISASALGMKCVTNFHGNRGRKMPVVRGVVVLIDDETGRVLALLDAAEITSIRTAAMSAVATRTLALGEATELAIIGSGAQASKHLEAMMLVRKIRSVRVASRTLASASRFVDDQREVFPDVGLQAVGTPREAITDADIICTVTSASEPVTAPEWIKSGAHINAVGSHSPDIREIDGETMRVARVVVDSREVNLIECGDCLIPISDGLFDASHVSDEIGEVIAGRKPGRSADDEVTVFQSCGLAVEDVAAASIAYAAAVHCDGGTEVEL